MFGALCGRFTDSSAAAMFNLFLKSPAVYQPIFSATAASHHQKTRLTTCSHWPANFVADTKKRRRYLSATNLSDKRRQVWWLVAERFSVQIRLTSLNDVICINRH